MTKAKLNMRAQRKQIINIFFDKTAVSAKVLHLTKRVHFIMLTDSIHNEDALPEEYY